MTTINAVGNGLSGATGSGSFVGSASPTLTGTPTTSQIGFTDTTKGIVGTATANNASSGFVGELISSHINLADAVSLTSTATSNVTSISLTAGDWDVFANVTIRDSMSAATIGTAGAWISLTSASALPDQSLLSQLNITPISMAGLGIQCPYFRASVSTTTSIFLCAQANFTGMNVNACGGIYARRVR